MAAGTQREASGQTLSGSQAMTSSERILIVGPAWVGDMVMAQSLFITLKQQDADCIIDVVAPAWSVPLLQRMPQVHEAIELAVGHKQLGLLTRYRLGRQLRSRHYDRAIVLPRSYKSALVPFFAGARRRTGYRGEHRYGVINDMRALDKRVLYQTVQRYVGLAYDNLASAPPVPYPQLSINSSNQQALLKKLGLNQDKRVIGLMPGAEYGPAKQWPVEYFQQLAGMLVAQGCQVWVFGSAKEVSLGEAIRQGQPAVSNLCGKTSLVDAVDLIALTQNNVTNDSGLMHIAAATGRPLVAIYGSSDPAYTPPLSDRAIILYQGLDCSPCFARQCRFGHTRCLTEIMPRAVLKQLTKG
ncbi:MAG: lipopolysaccharide heptosyltransferase II [Gammaproteobacteria bacterium]|jgi:heptosyltransferase II